MDMDEITIAPPDGDGEHVADAPAQTAVASEQSADAPAPLSAEDDVADAPLSASQLATIVPKVRRVRELADELENRVIPPPAKPMTLLARIRRIEQQLGIESPPDASEQSADAPAPTVASEHVADAPEFSEQERAHAAKMRKIYWNDPELIAFRRRERARFERQAHAR